MNRLSSVAFWFYAQLLRWYPRALRDTFGAELLEVVAERLQAAQARGSLAVAGVLWSEICDLPGIRFRAGASIGGRPASVFGRTALLAAMAPFLLNAVMQTTIWLNRMYPSLAPVLAPWLGWAVGSLVALILLAGVLYGLPRWSLPSLGILLGFIGLVLNGGATIAGLPIAWRIVYPDWVNWFGRMILPMLAVIALVLGICATLPWLRPFFRRWRGDWTQISFMLYGFMIFALELLDEHPSEMPLTVLGLLILAGGAWAYLRARTSIGRLCALGGAVTLMMLEAAFGMVLWTTPAWYEHYSVWGNLVEALVNWLWLVGALLAPAILALLPGRTPPTAVPAPPSAMAPFYTEPSDIYELKQVRFTPPARSH